MKKRFYFVLSLWLWCICLHSIVCVASTGKRRPRVAVVLSGGGAKGVAHISALKVIEEVGIPVDYVVGTSMGSIIGGLYAIGYSPAQLDSIVRTLDWEWLLSDKPKRSYRTITEQENEIRYLLSIPVTQKATLQKPESLIRGENISDMFAALTVGFHDSIDFKRLPIPFACIATDITDGSEVILNQGVLVEAMRASMAIPGVFSPVRKNGKILVDGGLVNNFPVDVARCMGADIVIGVDVQDGLRKAKQINSLSEIISQIVDIACKKKYTENLSLTDAYIKVNVKGYSAASFNHAAIDSLIHRGWQAADQCRSQLQKIKEQLNLSAPLLRPASHISQSLFHKNIFVNGIYFEGINTRDRNWIIRKCRLHEKSCMEYKQIEEALAILRTELNYSDVKFRLLDEEKGYKLVFHLTQKNVTSFNIGARFDSEEVASLLLGTSVYLSTKVPSTLSVTGRLGKQYMANLKYTFHPSLMRDISLQYTYNFHDINFYKNGHKIYNTTFNHHTFEARYSNRLLKNFRYQLGASYELYHNADVLLKTGNYPSIPNMTDNTFKYFAQLDYNTLDHYLFPKHGLRFNVVGSVYTDNLFQYRSHSPFYEISAAVSAAYSFNDKLALLPSASFRMLEGKDIPQVYKNILGGDTPSRYLTQQIPLMGVGHVEFVNDALLAGHLRLRYRITGKHYLSCIGNIASNTDKLNEIGQGKILYGIGLNYACDSKLGPLELSIGYSNLVEKFYGFANIGYYF
ncbi:patatin-like phospholipase family protein [Bacteroides faecis]|uniref:Patatin-like phospholipase family protein n=1 Tax=Bacteroides faecis TaxID=674529 RepID=A0ABY5TA40_9BACE|nr:patatin-like phospholipase family protein [Bacteroides faecis]UVQ74495.1 patatin-like phospholipase family protein [Bacteroides faecis]